MDEIAYAVNQEIDSGQYKGNLDDVFESAFDKVWGRFMDGKKWGVADSMMCGEGYVSYPVDKNYPDISQLKKHDIVFSSIPEDQRGQFVFDHVGSDGKHPSVMDDAVQVSLRFSRVNEAGQPIYFLLRSNMDQYDTFGSFVTDSNEKPIEIDFSEFSGRLRDKQKTILQQERKVKDLSIRHKGEMLGSFINIFDVTNGELAEVDKLRDELFDAEAELDKMEAELRKLNPEKPYLFPKYE